MLLLHNLWKSLYSFPVIHYSSYCKFQEILWPPFSTLIICFLLLYMPLQFQLFLLLSIFIVKISKIQIKWIDKEEGRLLLGSSISRLAELFFTSLLFILAYKFCPSNKICTLLDSIQQCSSHRAVSDLCDRNSVKLLIEW